MGNWDKTKTDLIKELSSDDTAIDNLLDRLSAFAETFSSEAAGDYGLPLDINMGRDTMRMVVMDWLTKV